MKIIYFARLLISRNYASDWPDILKNQSPLLASYLQLSSYPLSASQELTSFSLILLPFTSSSLFFTTNPRLLSEVKEHLAMPVIAFSWRKSTMIHRAFSTH